MADIRIPGSWRQELRNAVNDRIQMDDTNNNQPAHFNLDYLNNLSYQDEDGAAKRDQRNEEDLKEQLKGFAEAWVELLVDLGKGVKDVVRQSLVADDSYVVRKVGPTLGSLASKFRFLNDCFLPEDRDPLLAWPVVFFVLVLALAVLNVNSSHENPAPVVKSIFIHPTSASTILLPDGRHMAYQDQGVAGDRARYTLISPHAFLSSRLAGIPGIKSSLLEEFGIRLVTYDLPGFGESDPHPSRDLNTSALDVHYLANALGIYDKFWMLGYSTAAMHAWATLKYIPYRIAGAALFAPMVNPYDSGMTKEETSRTWERWEKRRKLMFSVARRFPSFLSYFYRRSFFSGKHGNIEEWFSLSLSEKDKALIETSSFKELWQRNVEESVRQGNMKPFIKEAVLQVSEWGFSLADLRTRRTCPGHGILTWLKSFYSKAECELTGFGGPIHLWQGSDDHVVPPPMAHYISRILPGATLHQLPSEGHFSYFFFCDKCHREILSTLFGDPLGPLENTDDTVHTDTTGQSSINVQADDATSSTDTVE
ncbi:hypothetical protein vseg_003642 [Gypsophila vaccaria]